MLSKSYIKFLISFVAGAVNVLAFAPFNYWVLNLLCFAILFFLWLRSDIRTAVIVGLCFGLGMFSFGVSWIYVSLHTFGEMPSILAGFVVLVLIVALALYPAICGGVQACFTHWRPSVRLIVLMPTLWVVFEWLRSWLFTGLPWLLSGYAYLDTPLSNYAPIGGVYLVSFLALLSVGGITFLCLQRGRKVIFSGVVVLIIWFIGWQLNTTAWTYSEGEPVNVAIIQNNVPLALKWDAQQRNRVVQSYMKNSWEHQNADLIVWPEGAVPEYIDNIATDFWQDVQRHPADFIFGTFHRDGQGINEEYYNSVVAVPQQLDGQIMIYRKQHLVPFGEYFPLKRWLSPLFSKLNIPKANLSPWLEPQDAIIAASNRFAVSICYEDSFPSVWRNQVAQAGILLNVSEDGWFGNSLAPHQRLQMARFRSRESERPMIRAANTGLSSIINWKGGIEDYAPQSTTTVVTGDVQPRIGATPFIVFGDKIALYLVFGGLLLAVLFGKKPKSKYSKSKY